MLIIVSSIPRIYNQLRREKHARLISNGLGPGQEMRRLWLGLISHGRQQLHLQ
jgi:hypothetical protein